MRLMVPSTQLSDSSLRASDAVSLTPARQNNLRLDGRSHGAPVRTARFTI
ncbi:hypothetical protein [Sphingobium sp.]|nr:hypothetical protein [Sphingobium sp.]HUD93559.1 hypothetical protein [Sphingobium sp.]